MAMEYAFFACPESAVALFIFIAMPCRLTAATVHPSVDDGDRADLAA